MSATKLCFFQEDFEDSVSDINGDTTYAGYSLNGVITSNPTTYGKELDEDDAVEDFIINGEFSEEEVENFTITMIRTDLSTYQMEAKLPIGGRPPRRPH